MNYGKSGRKNGRSKAAYEKVDSWFDLCALEHRILDFWKETGAFERLRELRAGGKSYSFLDGPITANNPMGVHHAWGRTYKDAYQRYWAMNGCEERYQNGFDCQGLWVEVEVEKAHGFSSKRQIEEYGIDRFVQDCKDRVVKYSAIQTEQSVRLGMWMDWENSYFTMSEENNYTIWAFLKKCSERGFVYRGTDVVPWSGRSGSSYSQMEIVEGRKLVEHPAIFVRFPIRDREKENLLVWTTTPWTLTCNVAAAVNVELDYVRIRTRHDGESYWLAAENLEYQRLDRQFREKKDWIKGVPKLKTIAQIFNEHGGFEIVETVKGQDLVGLSYDGPFDELAPQSFPGGLPVLDPGITDSAKEAHRVIDGGRDNKGTPVVQAGEGTGIVHIAPGCGDIDHLLGKKLGLPHIAPLDESANFTEEFGFLAGANATDPDTRTMILENLVEKGLLVSHERYPHYYPHCWRSGDELVFRLVDEWYIRMDWRDEIMKVAGDIRWIPAWGYDREIEWLTNMRDWMISKKRYWGLALPIWVCEECDSFQVIGGRDELEQAAVEGWELFDGHTPHRPWIDHVKTRCPECGGKASRIKDVGNPWLDAGIIAYSTTRYSTDRKYWERWVPAEFILECFPGQYRNWFYSLLAMSTMMGGAAPTKTIVGHALVRDESGEEMHKSKGNAIWFEEAAEEAGADVMRWLYVRQDPLANLNFGFNILREIRGRFINTVWNAYGFLANYARIAGFVPSAEPTPFERRSDFDRWILTELQRTVKKAREGIEDYDIRSSAIAIEAFVERLSNWYIRNNRRRFWATIDEPDCLMAFETLYECMETVTRLCAPMIPFVTEAIYQNLVRSVDPSAPESVHHTFYPEEDPARTDEEIASSMDALINLVGISLSARELAKIKVRQPLASMTVGPSSELVRNTVRRFDGLLRESLNVGEIKLLEPGTESPLLHELKPNPRTVGPRFGEMLPAIAKALEEHAERVMAAIGSGAEEFDLMVDGSVITMEKDDVVINTYSPEGQSVVANGPDWVSVDTRITEELRIEGLMRDLLRRMQVLRKDTGLEYEDRVRIEWQSESEPVIKAIERFTDYLMHELLAVSITRDKEMTDYTEITIEREALKVRIEKVGEPVD